MFQLEFSWFLMELKRFHTSPGRHHLTSFNFRVLESHDVVTFRKKEKKEKKKNKVELYFSSSLSSLLAEVRSVFASQGPSVD